MKLAFKRIFGYIEKEVPIQFNISTLISVSKALGIDFNEIVETAKNKPDEFMTELLWQGYITSCKEKYKKPKYTRSYALVWYNHLSKEAYKELNELILILFGEMPQKGKYKKKEVKNDQV